MPDHMTRGHARAHLIATVIALAAAGVLVYWTSTARPMWVDEEMLALNVRDRGFGQLAGPLWLDQSAPLGWLVLERLALLALGANEPAVRTLTVLFGIGTLATAWWIGRRWMTPIGAALLVALCGTGEWLVFFTLELKHYSADAVGALLIPALAARALDARELQAFGRRVAQWWAAAAAALWFSNGALFVTPACAIVLLGAAIARRDHAKPGAQFLGGIGWLGSFGLAYVFVLRHALANAYLKTYWAFAFPPTGDGIGATAQWITAQAAPLAVKPIGTGLPVVFWLAYMAGIMAGLARRSNLAIVCATVPGSAIALAVLHVVPTFERLAIWSVPCFYVGLALCADAAARWAGLAPTAGSSGRRRLWVPQAVLASTLGITALVVSYDIVRRGVFAIEHRPRSNYGLDDRSSVNWLVDARRPGDAVLSTHYGLAAIWWYGKVDISSADRGGRLADGTPLYEIHHVADPGECVRWSTALDSLARTRSRLVVYLGFRMNVEPEGFDRLVLEQFGRRWPLVGYKEYAELSRVAIFDLGGAPSGPLVVPSMPGRPSPEPVPVPPGCVSVTPARRW
jgi:hypothetical protein